MTEVATKKPEVRVLNSNRFKTHEYQNTHYCVVVEEGTTVNDLQSPAFWAHVATMFRPYDEINIMADDESFFAKAVVYECGANYARVNVYVKIDFGGTERIAPAAFETHEIKWRGPHLKFAVVRKADSAVLMENFPNRDAATVWLRSHLQATA